MAIRSTDNSMELVSLCFVHLSFHWESKYSASESESENSVSYFTQLCVCVFVWNFDIGPKNICEWFLPIHLKKLFMLSRKRGFRWLFFTFFGFFCHLICISCIIFLNNLCKYDFIDKTSTTHTDLTNPICASPRNMVFFFFQILLLCFSLTRSLMQKA